MPTLAEIRKSGRMPTAEEYADFYERQANPRAGDNWTPSNQHIDTQFARTQFALRHILPGMSVLELGSQDGGLTKHLIHATGGGHVTSIDIAPTYIARTADYLDRLHLLGPGVNLEVADVSTYDTRRRYDVIVAFEILEHVIDPRQVLRNVWRLLRRRSGTVLITVPDETVLDTEGEHIHALHPSDIIQIAGESTGIRPVVWHEHVWYFATIERGGVSYVP